MNALSIGDLAHTFQLRRQSAQIKQDLARLGAELTSGQVSDVSGHLGGRFASLTDYERDLTMLTRQIQSANEVQTQAGAMQLALDTIQTATTDLLGPLAIASTAGTPTDRATMAQDARAKLGTIISALNADVAGRALFSGTSVTTPPLATVDTVLTELRGAISGATTAADVLAAADALFDTPGGGFETVIYQGGSADLQPISLGAGEAVSLSLRADNQALRDTIKAVALTALADDPALALDDAEARVFLQALPERVLATQDDVTGLRATVGFAEERTDEALSRLSAERTSVEIARGALLEADPYETATQLESAQVQLETLYTITARSSRLSLVNFL